MKKPRNSPPISGWFSILFVSLIGLLLLLLAEVIR